MVDRATLVTARLAFVNAVSFSATTIMPLWVAGLPDAIGASAAMVGLAATFQLAFCGLFNLATPLLFGRIAPLRLARWALVVALGAGLVQAVAGIVPFMAAALVSGAALGVILNVTNRIVAGAAHVQHSYALFQIVEVCFASSLYFGSAMLMARFGASSIFLAAATVAALGLAMLHRLALDGHNPAAGTAPGPLRQRRAAAIALGAMVCFFIGQSSINSWLIPIGRLSGLAPETVATIVAGCMVTALAGAIFSRIVGDRLGTLLPVGIVTTILALDFLLLTRPLPRGLFTTGIVVLMMGTIFVVPYFFTFLAKLDRAGRYASIAPAMLLAGVAIGPSLAIFLSGRFGFAALGAVAAALVVGSAMMFVAVASAARRAVATGAEAG